MNEKTSHAVQAAAHLMTAAVHLNELGMYSHESVEYAEDGRRLLAFALDVLNKENKENKNGN